MQLWLIFLFDTYIFPIVYGKWLDFARFIFDFIHGMHLDLDMI